MSKPKLDWEAIVSQPFAENSYVVRRYGARECLIIDPGFEPELIQQHVASANLVPLAILNTHGHSDHIAGNAAMKQLWPDCPLLIGKDDAEKLTDPAKNLSAGFGGRLVSPEADRLVTEGDVLEFGDMTWEVRETPGHSIGHVVFVARDQTPNVVIGGDVLFQGSVGRTDFPDGSMEQLVNSIHEKLFNVPDDTIVLPGHGPPTTVAEEKRGNAFVGAPAGFQF